MRVVYNLQRRGEDGVEKKPFEFHWPRHVGNSSLGYSSLDVHLSCGTAAQAFLAIFAVRRNRVSYNNSIAITFESCAIGRGDGDNAKGRRATYSRHGLLYGSQSGKTT